MFDPNWKSNGFMDDAIAHVTRWVESQQVPVDEREPGRKEPSGGGGEPGGGGGEPGGGPGGRGGGGLGA